MTALFDAPRSRRCRAVGFKTKPKDVWDLVAFGEVLRARDVRVVSLRRRNPVKLAVSTLNARRLHERSGRWNRVASDPELGPLQVAPAELSAVIERCTAAQAEVDALVGALGLASIALDYEDLLVDRTAWLRRVTDFLGVAPLSAAGRVEKATDDDLRVALADFDAHAAYFRATAHAPHFDP
jgi:LPS sulfotransferase NodH